MFKSIFSKLLFAYFLIIIITFTIVGVMLFSLLEDYVTSEKEEVLIYAAEKINEITTVFLENNNPIAERLYRINIESYGANIQSFIIVVDISGKIFATSSSQNRIIEGENIKNKEQFKETMLGKQTKKIGTFEGFFNETVLTIGMPILYNGEIAGTVFLNSPIPEINKVTYDVFKLFLIAVSVAIIIAFLLIFFLSDRISKPLKEISRVARTISDGEFENRVCSTSNDEIGELAKSFNSMAESLQNLEDMRKSFVANVSHELRSPMTTIQGFIEGIIDKTIPENQQFQYLNIVLDETKRLSRLINDLLDLSKMEAGETLLEYKKFDINELIRLAIIQFENSITKKDIYVNVSFEEGHSYVKADKDSIFRVIKNLLENAIKFSNYGGEIDISVEIKVNKIYISVKDNGVGIEKEELKYIWDRFYKTDKSRSEDKTGTGLGLFIVKNIINQHDQNIWVESEGGKYTIFKFSLEKA